VTETSRTLTLTIAVLLVWAACASSAEALSVTISYSPRIDWVCSIFRGPSIEDEWKAELLTRKGEFERQWSSLGPNLISATEAMTGKAFPAGEVTARLTLCNLPSQSIFGVSVNMRYALRSFKADPVPMRYKVYTLFHELLHNYLDAYPIRDSALLERYASEPARVRNHLHLFALEKAALIELGESEALEDVIDIDSQLPNGYYKRAWEIVNSNNDEYQKYVAEFSR